MWHAVLKDKTQIDQVDQNGNEHLFQEVRDNFNHLALFFITENNKVKITVDLVRGLIYLGAPQEAIQELTEEKQNIRLVYYRRNKVTLGVGNSIQEKTVLQCVGLQYLDRSGSNRKILAQIDESGNILIGE